MHLYSVRLEQPSDVLAQIETIDQVSRSSQPINFGAAIYDPARYGQVIEDIALADPYVIRLRKSVIGYHGRLTDAMPIQVQMPQDPENELAFVDFSYKTRIPMLERILGAASLVAESQTVNLAGFGFETGEQAARHAASVAVFHALAGQHTL